MSQEKIVLLGQSAEDLIELFRSESAPSAQIREYFTNYCDCDIAEWLIAQLIANNQEVVDKVNELLEARDLYPIKREAIHPKKVFFNDLMVLDLFFKKMPPGNRDLTAGFFSASTGYVNHFSVGLKTT